MTLLDISREDVDCTIHRASDPYKRGSYGWFTTPPVPYHGPSYFRGLQFQGYLDREDWDATDWVRDADE